MKRALITGVLGQDGSYLTGQLLRQGYEVFGLDLPSFPSHPTAVLLGDRYCAVDMMNTNAVCSLVETLRPNEVYHFAGISFVGFDFAQEQQLLLSHLLPAHALLSSLKEFAPESRLFFAGSSEMFGNAEISPQNESTPFRPRSIYGIAKTAVANLVRYYRDFHGLYAAVGILYNHESPRRGEAFVTRKVTKAAVRIKAGLQQELRLGNLDTVRDWGYAPDYTVAMQQMLQQPQAQDYVLATGESHSVRELVDAAFTCVGLNWEDFVVVDPAFFRPVEEVPLIGCATKAKRELGLTQTLSFREVVAAMVNADQAALLQGEGG